MHWMKWTPQVHEGSKNGRLVRISEGEKHLRVATLNAFKMEIFTKFPFYENVLNINITVKPLKYYCKPQ